MRKVRTPFSSPLFGNCEVGDILDIPKHLEQQFEDNGLIEKEGKETKPEPQAKIETKPQVEKKKTKGKK